MIASIMSITSCMVAIAVQRHTQTSVPGEELEVSRGEGITGLEVKPLLKSTFREAGGRGVNVSCIHNPAPVYNAGYFNTYRNVMSIKIMT